MPPTTPLPEIRTANQSLISTLESHPAFPSQSTRRTGKVYFMWDFAKRTDSIFDLILADPISTTKAQREELERDSLGRCLMLQQLINDTTGMAAMMFQEQPGQGVDLGVEVKDASDRVAGLVNPVSA